MQPLEQHPEDVNKLIFDVEDCIDEDEFCRCCGDLIDNDHDDGLCNNCFTE